MPRVLVCTGVLGGGAALVFMLAGVVAALVPPTHYTPAVRDVRMPGRADVTAPAVAGAPRDVVPVPAPSTGAGRSDR